MTNEQLQRGKELKEKLDILDNLIEESTEFLRLYTTPRDDDGSSDLPLVSITRARIVIEEKRNYESGPSTEERVISYFGNLSILQLLKDRHELLIKTREKNREEFAQL